MLAKLSKDLIFNVAAVTYAQLVEGEVTIGMGQAGVATCRGLEAESVWQLMAAAVKRYQGMFGQAKNVPNVIVNLSLAAMAVVQADKSLQVAFTTGGLIKFEPEDAACVFAMLTEHCQAFADGTDPASLGPKLAQGSKIVLPDGKSPLPPPDKRRYPRM